MMVSPVVAVCPSLPSRVSSLFIYVISENISLEYTMNVLNFTCELQIQRYCMKYLKVYKLSFTNVTFF